MTKIYLALYKGHKTGWTPKAIAARLSDWLTRKLTKGQYSHCEIAAERQEFVSGDYYPITTYDCYSSSIRDGGVRCKNMPLDRDKWDLIELQGVDLAQIQSYFARTKGHKYDWWGALGIVLGIKQKRSKFFCSEWCFNVLHSSDKGWRFSPNDLAVILNNQNDKGAI